MTIIQTESFQLAVDQYGAPAADKLALILPGKLDTKSYAHIKSHSELLAELGYFVVSFDPPGSWDSPGDIELYTMTNYVRAVNELIEHFGSRPTLLVGHSRGGTVAMLASENKHVVGFVAVMSQSGPSRLGIGGDRVNEGFVESVRDVPATKKTKVFNLPLSYYDDAASFDAKSVLARSSKPKLFIVGQRDTTCPAALVKEGYIAASEPKQLITVDAGHDYRKSQDQIELVNDVITSFVKRL